MEERRASAREQEVLDMALQQQKEENENLAAEERALKAEIEARAIKAEIEARSRAH